MLGKGGTNFVSGEGRGGGPHLKVELLKLLFHLDLEVLLCLLCRRLFVLQLLQVLLELAVLAPAMLQLLFTLQHRRLDELAS